MITTPNGKTLMNEQEAIQWLLDNNALPFQCTANYAAGTEIGLGTIVNPSPAKVRVGSLIFFADSKVSTVVGLTSNSFICSDQYNDLVDDIVYVSNVQLNASGHLIVTLSNGTNIDAGLIKQISSFSINASQHLIASYNDGTSTDLGAIFSGNITVSGNLTVTGGISGNAITGNSIIENMSGYVFTKYTADMAWDAVYVGICKNGNKLTLVIFGSFKKTSSNVKNTADICNFQLPQSVMDALYPYTIGSEDRVLCCSETIFQDTSDRSTQVKLQYQILKTTTPKLMVRVFDGLSNLTNDASYVFRIEQTFLLSENLAA